MKQGWKTILFWALVILLILVMAQYLNEAKQSKPRELDYSAFYQAIEDGEVSEVTFQGNRIIGTLISGESFISYGPNDLEIFEILAREKVKVTYKEDNKMSLWQHLLTWLPMIAIFVLLFFFFRQMQNTGGKAMSFGKARARLLSESSKRVTFEDVAGIDEAKQELEEIIGFLKDPKKFTRLGGRIPKGVLLVGAPGTGKTLLARAIAGEAGVPFFSISGSDFVEMFVGVGAARVRDLFIQGKKNAPCIIFIDEIDAVGRHRGAGLGGGHDEREQTLNQLLVEMDGFESNEGVILISATNRPDVLDPALLRPGRFDRQIIVPLPDVRGRGGILEVHTRKAPLAENVELDLISRGTPGFSGADLENLVNEAALLAARKDKEKIDMEDFEEAKDKVLMGTERRSMIISEEEKQITAYHEAGHAMVARLIPGTDPVHKVSIIPRGMALGVTQQLPTEDKYLKSRTYCNNQIAVMLGGRAAEMLKFNEPSNGAASDLEQATGIARLMVCKWGMSDKLGPLIFGKEEELVFLGKEISQQKDYSESTAVQIDHEVKRIVIEGYERAEGLLKDNMDKLRALSEALLEREALEGAEIDMVIRGEKLGPLKTSKSEKSAQPERPESAGKKKKEDLPGKLGPAPAPARSKA